MERFRNGACVDGEVERKSDEEVEREGEIWRRRNV